MATLVDHEGNPLFAPQFTLKEHQYACTAGEVHQVEVIKTGGNIWFHANTVLELMGMNVNDTGNSGRTLRRIDHPDIIKIKDTPLRFSDGRRNRGSLVSPKALQVLVEGKTKGFHPIKAIAFLAWVQDCLLSGEGFDHWSPKAAPKITLEPVFRAVTKVIDEDEAGRPLDPLRPHGTYPHTLNAPRLRPDEVEFCMGRKDCFNPGDCWCGGKGGIKTFADMVAAEADAHTEEDREDFSVFDDEDDFSDFNRQ